MFGNGYFGTAYFADTYWGPLQGEDTGTKGGDNKLTKREIAGLKAIYEDIEKITIPPIPEIPILSDIQDVVLEPIPEYDDQPSIIPTLQDKLAGEQDIGLILAILTAHEN